MQSIFSFKEVLPSNKVWEDCDSYDVTTTDNHYNCQFHRLQGFFFTEYGDGSKIPTAGPPVEFWVYMAKELLDYNVSYTSKGFMWTFWIRF